MERSVSVELARGHPFLEGLRTEHVDKMAAIATLVRFAADEIIFREGDKADAFYLILSGSVALELCTPGDILRVQTLVEGDELGWWWFLKKEPSPFQARSLVRGQALRFEMRNLRKACLEDPDLGYALEHRLLQSLSNRLQASLVQLVDIYGHEVSSHKHATAKVAS